MLLCATVLLAGQSRSIAADLYQADGIDIRWDTTLRYSEMFRLSGHSAAAVADPNSDDGDRNFAAGLVSNRIDLLSEFDLSDGAFGIHASGAAWYDTVYHQRNNNDWPQTFNPVSVPHNQFTDATERLQGEDAELLDAFFYGSFDFSDVPVSFRIGRDTLLWGESEFFADNGIAGGQAPIDAIKGLNQPGAEAKELFLPVGQVSITVQPRPNFDVGFYYQFEWEKTRLPASGSYLSDADYLDAGGERLIVAPGEYLYRGQDRTPSSSGQFGIALRSTLDDIDFGLYALRYNAKEPEVLIIPGIASYGTSTIFVTNPSIVDLAKGRVGDYELVYPTDIDIYGVSFSFYVGDTALAGEISARQHMPLVSTFGGIPGSVGGGYGGLAAVRPHYSYPPSPLPPPLVLVTPQTNYPAGDTLHAQFSSVTTFPRSNIWDGANLTAEVAMNDLLELTEDRYDLDPTRDRFAAALRAEFQPEYFQVLPNLDMAIPLSLGIGLIGRSAVNGSENAGAGDVDAGFSFTYRAEWKAAVTFTHFIGSPPQQPFADRDFVSLSIQRTF